MVTFLASRVEILNIRLTRKVRWAVLSHVIVAYVSTRVRSKGNISPYGLSEVSVLTELPVGHLCCSLTDVPPQSNSPSVGVRVGFDASPGDSYETYNTLDSQIVK